MRPLQAIVLLLSVLVTLSIARPVAMSGKFVPEETTTTLWRRGGWGFLRGAMGSVGFSHASANPSGQSYHLLQQEVPKHGVDVDRALLHQHEMRQQEQLHLARLGTASAEAQKQKALRDKFNGIAKGIRSGQLGNDAHLRPPPPPKLPRSSSTGSRPSLLARRGGLGGGAAGWGKLRGAFGYSGPSSSQRANPAGGEVVKRLGGSKLTSYEALPSVHHGEDLSEGAKALLASNKARDAKLLADHAEYTITHYQAQVPRARMAVVRAFERGKRPRLTHSVSAPPRLQSHGHHWLGVRSVAERDE